MTTPTASAVRSASVRSVFGIISHLSWRGSRTGNDRASDVEAAGRLSSRDTSHPMRAGRGTVFARLPPGYPGCMTGDLALSWWRTRRRAHGSHHEHDGLRHG